MRSRRLFASVAAIVTLASVATAGAKAGGPIGAAASIQEITADPTPTTLYLHGHTPAGALDATHEFAETGSGPFMDRNAPTELAPKVATWTAAGNQNFRKNFLNAYWGGKLTGTITGNPKVSFWIVAPASTRVEVSLFGDGGIGAASPMARKSQEVLAPVPTLVEVEFTGLVAPIEEEMVLQIGAYTDNQATPAKVLYDSTQFASGMAFGLLPLGALLPNLDDPAGIAHLGSTLIATNSGSGHVVQLADGVPSSVIASGLVSGGFNRGPTGIAVDGDGKIYYAIADTGEIRVADGSGSLGVLARGLGAPMGIAFGSDGRLYVADAFGKRIHAVSANGSWTTVATLAEAPWAIAAAPGGKLAVSTNAGSGTNAVGRVRIVDPANGSSSVLTQLINGSSAEGLAYGATGNLYVGSGRNGILYRVAPAGGSASNVATQLGGPMALSFSPSGNLIVATQGEGRTAGDAILSVDVDEAGAALPAPAFSPVVSAPARPVWVYRSGVSIDPGTFAGPLPSSELRYVGGNAFEPTMGIQDDGDIFFVGGDFDQAGGVLGSPDIYRSRDNGNTWTRHQPTDARGEDAPVLTLDPYVWVDNDADSERVFSFDLTAACQYLSYSDDDGETWTSNPLACGVPPIDHQTLIGGVPRAHTTNGYDKILYHCSNHVAESPCARSLDGGDTWEPGGVAYVGTDLPDRVLNPTQTDPAARFSEITGGALCGGLHGHAITDPDGRIFVPKGHCGRPWISMSEDDGTTWTAHPVSRTVPSNGTQTTVASDAAGNLYYLWVGPGRALYLSTSTDHGVTWSDAKMISPPGVSEVNIPSIDAGAPGNVAIYFMGTPNTYGYTPNTARQAWNSYIVTSTNALTSDPVFTAAATAPLTDPLVRGACGPGRCQGVFDFLDVIIDPAGRAWATVVDGCIERCVGNRTASSTAARGAVAPLMTGTNLRTGAALSPLP